MKQTLIILGLLATFNAHAFDKSEFIGNWKMTDFKCASGQAVNMNIEEVDFKFDIYLNVLSSDRVNAKVDYTYTFKKEYLEKSTKDIKAALEGFKAEAPTPENQKLIAEYERILKEFDKNTQPKSCSDLQRMTYYLKGNTFYTNDVNNLSTCTDPDDDGTDDGVDLEAATIDIKGDKLIVTDGPEVEEKSLCPMGDRQVMTFVRQ